MKMTRRFATALGFLAAGAVQMAHAAPPATKFVTAPMMTLTNAWSYYDSQPNPTTHTPGVAAWTGSPPEIVALARSLGSERYENSEITADQFIQNVFDYVRNNIDTEFRFGLGKGGRGALIDQSGTSFDQAELMVKLLRASSRAVPNVNYHFGTISLAPAEFGVWSGLITGLNETTQAFSVRARAACQFLADGGIPATVNGNATLTDCNTFSASTNLTGVVMGHAWVGANGKIYDPAYKKHRLDTGIDIPSGMGCGTTSSPTCGEGIRAAMMGAGSSTGTFAGANFIDAPNRDAVRTQLMTYAQALESRIKTSYPGAELVDIVGGTERDLAYSPTGDTTLTYTLSDHASPWSEIPDQYRTRFRVRIGTYDYTFFADEIAGRRVRMMSWTEFFVDHQVYASTGCASCIANTAIIDVNHPYAASSGAYGDVTGQQFLMVDMPEANSSDRGTPPVTIVHSWGNATVSTERYVSDLQMVDPYAGSTSSECGGIVGGYLEGVGFTPDGWIEQTYCENASQPTLAAKLLHQGGRADKIVEGVTRSNLTRHHNIGIIYARVWGATSLSYLSVQSELSANSRTAAATARTAALEGSSAMWGVVEGSLYQQMADKYRAVGVASDFLFMGGKFLDVTPSNMATVIAALPESTTYWSDDRKGRLQDAANNGYSTIMPVTALANGGSLFYTSAASSYAVLEGAKGGSALGSANPTAIPMKTIDEQPPSWHQANKSSVSLATGELTLTPPPDIVTGVGDFPQSLSFQRMYRSGGVVERSVGNYVNRWHPQSTDNPPSRFSTYHEYTGGDSDYSAKMGGAWTHNWEILARYGNDAPAAFGATSGLDAGAAIAGIYALTDAAKTASFQNRLATIFGAGWVGERLMYNHVTITGGGNSESFHRLSDLTFNPPQGSGSRLLQTNEILPNTRDYRTLTFRYIRRDGDEIGFDWAGNSVPRNEYDPLFKATNWTFPDGVIVTFGYEHFNQDYQVPAQPNIRVKNTRYILTSVSNNLGRRLNLNSQVLIIPSGSSEGGWAIGGFKLTSVTDENARSVGINISGCSTDHTWACPTFTVTSPTGAPTKYEYAPNGSSPDPSIPLRPDYQVRRWFKPSDQVNPYSTVLYDELFRVRRKTDLLGRVTKYAPGGVAGTELWKRGEQVNAKNNANVAVYDERGNLVAATDANGQTTKNEYDDQNRLVRTINPELDEIVRTYDVRSNPLTVVRKAKPDSGLTDINQERYTYVEPATRQTCNNQKTCNRLATTRDPRDQTTSFTYSSTTGQLLTLTAPTVELGTGTGTPKTTLCYKTFTLTNGSVTLLSGKIERVTGSVNRVTSFDYSTSNKYALLTAIVDPKTTLTPPSSSSLTCPTASKPTGLGLTTTFAFDSIGNLQSINGPRTDVTDVTSYRFDAARRLTRVDAPLGSINRFTYDIDGLRRTARKSVVALPAVPTDGNPANPTPTDLIESQWSTTTSDFYGMGMLKSVRDPEGNTTQFSYDAIDELTLTTDADNRRTGAVYDPAGQKLCVWRGWDSAAAPTDCLWDPATYLSQGNAGKLRYAFNTYSNNGKQLTVQDAGNNISQLIYDGFDRLTFTLYPDPNTGNRCTVTAPVTGSTVPNCTPGSLQTFEQYTYDAAGNRVTLRTRNNDTATFTYDNKSRMRTKDVSGTPALGLVTYGYNLMDEPTSLASLAPAGGGIPAHGVTYDYDGAGRKLYEENLINGSNRRVSYGYNDAGQRKQTIWPDGYYVYYTYDALGRMDYVYENSTSANELAHYLYDPLSRRQELRFAGQSTNKIGYTYETDSQLDVLTNTLKNVTVTLDYGHKASGQINSLIANDGFYLATPATLSSTAYVPNKLNQYDTVGGNAAKYDLNGNLLSWFRLGTKQTYTYDAENRLRTAATDGTATSSITYDYDVLGRRISKTVSGTSTYYLLDGDEEIGEYASDGVLQRRYITGSAIDDRIARAEGSATANPTKTYYHVNHQGSVIDITSPDGTIVQQLAYDEYGKLTSQPPAVPTGEAFRYTGRRYDDETKLYYYRARYYSPELGRFLQVDPIGFGDDFLVYSYVSNDPISRSDPKGNKGCAGVLTVTGHGGGCTSDPASYAYDNWKQDAAAGPTSAGKVTMEGIAETAVTVHHAAEATEGLAAAAAGFGPPKAAVPGVAVSKMAGGATRFTGPIAIGADGVKIVGQLAEGDGNGAAKSGLELGERLAGAAAGASFGAWAGGGVFDEITVPVFSVIGGLAPHAMESVNDTVVEASAAGIDAANKEIDKAMQAGGEKASEMGTAIKNYASGCERDRSLGCGGF